MKKYLAVLFASLTLMVVCAVPAAAAAQVAEANVTLTFDGTTANCSLFDLSPYVSWNSMNYSTSTSSNGMLMHLFLDHNGVKPVPHGTLIITEHIAAYGNMNVSLAF